MLTIDSKIKIIRDFRPVAQPHFKNEDAIGYIIWGLYNRIFDAIKSVVVLLDNGRYYDAFLIAGHALETCAVLSYIKDNDTEMKQLKNYNKYVARSAVGSLLAILDTGESNLAIDYEWNAYVAMLCIFFPVGASIIKDKKTDGKSAAERHEAIIKVINSRRGTNAEKSKILRDSYQRPIPQDYITSFSKRFDNIDDGEFSRFYMKYCEFKHSNMLSPGALVGDINDKQIEWPLNIMLLIIVYLDKSKLTPYTTKNN